MNLLSGYPFWLIKNGLPFNYPALENDVRTGVAIIGGGISGALMGYYLSKAGVDCVIADSRTIGLGSTCASTSLLQYETDTPLHILQDKVGLQNAVTAYKLGEEAVVKLGLIDKEIGCNEYESKKSLFYAAEKKHIPLLKKEFAARAANNFKVDYLEEGTLPTSYGLSIPNPAILSETAAQTDAYKFTHALHQFSKQKGIKVYDRTSVIKIDHQKKSVILTTANGCTIKAKKMVYANGYEAVDQIDQIGKKIVTLHSTYAAASEQCTSDIVFWKDETLVWNTADPYLYMRTTKDRRIVIGGRDELFSNAVKRDVLIPKKSKLLKKDVEQLLPAINYKQEFTWAGTFAATKDGLPFIGAAPHTPNSYFSLGYGGNGITFSLIGAAIITDLIITGKSKYGSLFSFDRI
jgi:glycine/D-amino acid oxidase-like deaminating enzyme